LAEVMSDFVRESIMLQTLVFRFAKSVRRKVMNWAQGLLVQIILGEINCLFAAFVPANPGTVPSSIHEGAVILPGIAKVVFRASERPGSTFLKSHEHSPRIRHECQSRQKSGCGGSCVSTYPNPAP
jgi:hypothetical protein